MKLFKRFFKGAPLRTACSKHNMDLIFNILENIKGKNCRILKDRTGLNWQIIVDGFSDTPTSSAPWSGSGGLGLEDGDYYFVVDVKWENYQLKKKVNHWNVTNGVLTINEGEYEVVLEAVEEQI